MEQMEFRDNKMETERLNNRKILGEVRFIVVSQMHPVQGIEVILVLSEEIYLEDAIGANAIEYHSICGHILG